MGQRPAAPSSFEKFLDHVVWAADFYSFVRAPTLPRYKFCERLAAELRGKFWRIHSLGELLGVVGGMDDRSDDSRRAKSWHLYWARRLWRMYEMELEKA